MQHTVKCKPKIVDSCTLPQTSVQPNDVVVSELAAIEFAGDRATLLETGPGVSVEQVIAVTEAQLTISNNVWKMKP